MRKPLCLPLATSVAGLHLQPLLSLRIRLGFWRSWSGEELRRLGFEEGKKRKGEKRARD
jgi:hypothetical protein